MEDKKRLLNPCKKCGKFVAGEMVIVCPETHWIECDTHGCDNCLKVRGSKEDAVREWNEKNPKEVAGEQ